jgi:hypothetical protein
MFVKVFVFSFYVWIFASCAGGESHANRRTSSAPDAGARSANAAVPADPLSTEQLQLLAGMELAIAETLRVAGLEPGDGAIKSLRNQALKRLGEQRSSSSL